MSPAMYPPPEVIKIDATEKHQIGDARMEQDGTILLRQRLVHEGFVGETLERVQPGTPDYDKVRAHLPNLKVGHPVPIYNDWGD